jgi:hypothetical protein
MAIGMNIPAISNFPRNVGIAGRNLPISTPVIIQRNTHNVRYL